MAGGSKKKIIMIAVVALAVVGVGFGGFMMGRKGSAATPQEKTMNDEIAEDAGGHGAEPEKADGHGAAAEGGHGAAAEGGHGGGHGEAAGAPAASAKNNLIFKFEDFTVNLMDPRGRAYLQVTIQVEAKNAEGSKRIAENEIPLRDATNFLLMSKTREDIGPVEGRERLKRELTARYEGLLGPNVVNNIYFTSFMIVTQ